MTGQATRADGVVRAGRLLETRRGVVDLPSGLPARLDARLLGDAEARAWRPPVAAEECLPAVPDGLVDAWLSVDLLGRWIERRLRVEWPPWYRLHGDARLMACWLAHAAQARVEGLVPIHLSCLTYVSDSESRRWPPLVVGVPSMARGLVVPSALTAWVQRGGRCARLVDAPDLPRTAAAAVPPAAHPAPPRPVDPRAAPRLRAVRRAWTLLPRAGGGVAVVVQERKGGATSMTHLELLDVGTRIDDVRQDAAALALACRLARQHTQADHVAVLVPRDGTVAALASDGPHADAPLVWPHLCAQDAPPGVVSVSGWHAVARDGGDGGAFWIGARWPSAEQGAPRVALLAVFGRLVAPRVPLAAPAPASTPGLEDTLIGESLVMRDVRAQIALAARAPFPVLIRGESGCGKELAARAIHAIGTRRHRRCAAINCAALPDELIETELFGHVRGAFTGAASDRAGLFDEADGGTLFLDEVGELGGKAQAKLLRVLQDGEVRRVGENHARRVDVRVIAATNVSLEEAVRRGQFRADLFYRLDVVRVRMPSLRERREDVPLLARHFWRECTARLGSRARLEGRVLDALARYDWPGNVRQLQNTLAALAVRAPLRGSVVPGDLPPELLAPPGTHAAARGGLDAARREFEAHYVREALSRAGGRPTMAARDLGVTRQGLSKLVRRPGLEGPAAVPRLP